MRLRHHVKWRSPQPWHGLRCRLSANTIVYSFHGANDGVNPRGVLLHDGGSKLYGTTENGGANGLGIVFKVHPKRKRSLSILATDGKNFAEAFTVRTPAQPEHSCLWKSSAARTWRPSKKLSRRVRSEPQRNRNIHAFGNRPQHRPSTRGVTVTAPFPLCEQQFATKRSLELSNANASGP